MAYSIVPTVATGDLWTAANHNTYIRDNFAAGVPDIFTTKGDIAVATGADAVTRVGVGSNGYILAADSAQASGVNWILNHVIDLMTAKGMLAVGSGVDAMTTLAVGSNDYLIEADSAAGSGLAWRGFAGAMFHQNAGTSVSASTDTIINFQTQIYDPRSRVTTGASWKFTAEWAGYYLISASVTMASASFTQGNSLRMAFFRNNSLYGYSGRMVFAYTGTYTPTVTGIGVIQMSVNDYVDCRIWHNESTARSTVGSNEATIWIARIR